MKLRIYQINLDRDVNGVAFESYDWLSKYQKSKDPDPSIYDLAYSGEMEVCDLEDIYRIFNTEHPENFKGRSMSVSDIVEIVSGDIDAGYYYCDSIGFKKVDFDPLLASTLPDKIKVLLLEPDKVARITEISTSLEDLQKAVGGYIEAYYPFEDPGVVIICNEEGKYNGSGPNRAVYDKDGNMMDIIFGTFFICGCGDEEFISLSEGQMKRYMEMFKLPQRFIKESGQIMAVSYDPEG